VGGCPQCHPVLCGLPGQQLEVCVGTIVSTDGAAGVAAQSVGLAAGVAAQTAASASTSALAAASSAAASLDALAAAAAISAGTHSRSSAAASSASCRCRTLEATECRECPADMARCWGAAVATWGGSSISELLLVCMEGEG
jgi:hypothetical protein